MKEFVIKLCLSFILVIFFFGCSENTPHNSVQSGQITIKFSDQAGGDRSFLVTLPKHYSSKSDYKLVFVFSGTNATGSDMQKYVGVGWNGVDGLESSMPNTIFVYPDPKIRDFPDWGNSYRGWLLGPFAGPAEGMEDIYFIQELLDWLTSNYSIDSNKIFATGHSWGGDMTAVVGCFLGNKFAAIAPVAANRPYWFESEPGALKCTGSPAVWTFFGNNDDYFGENEPNKGDFGREQNRFWMDRFNCNSSYINLDVGPKGESIEYNNCITTVRFTLYSPAFSGGDFLPGHQPPDFYLSVVPEWFNSF